MPNETNRRYRSLKGEEDVRTEVLKIIRIVTIHSVMTLLDMSLFVLTRKGISPRTKIKDDLTREGSNGTGHGGDPKCNSWRNIFESCVAWFPDPPERSYEIRRRNFFFRDRGAFFRRVISSSTIREDIICPSFTPSWPARHFGTFERRFESST